MGTKLKRDLKHWILQLVLMAALVAISYWLQHRHNAAVLQQQIETIEEKASYIETLEAELEKKQEAIQQMDEQ